MSATSRKQGLFLGLAIVLVAVDQASKYAAEAFLGSGQVVNVLGELLRFRLAYNDAAAFSLGFGATWVLAAISSLGVLLLIWFGPRAKTPIWTFIASLALGGAAGNWVDRVFKEPQFFSGHVVDFIQIPFNFPIFNLADTFLVTAVCLAILRTFLGDEIGGGVAK